MRSGDELLEERLGHFNELARLSRESIVDVLVLCHSLTADEKRDAAVMCRDRWPEVKVIVLVSFAGELPKPVGEPLRIATGPQALVDLSREMAGRAPAGGQLLH